MDVVSHESLILMLLLADIMVRDIKYVLEQILVFFFMNFINTFMLQQLLPTVKTYPINFKTV